MTPENLLREQIRMALINLGFCPKTDNPQELIKGVEKATGEKVTGYKRAKEVISYSRHIVINGWAVYY